MSSVSVVVGWSLVERLIAHARGEGLLVFAGAGISTSPPSSLPNWWQFNEAVLNSLAGSVAAYTTPKLGEWIFGELLARRSAGTQFAPDYMADIIVEEAGMDYFEIVQALDAEETNAAHRGIARLAKSGHVRAFVTTNFDRMVERAMTAASVPYEVFASADQYSDLEAKIAAGTLASVPVIKVHGTVEDIDSMVDTMSQRLVGRPEALERTLAALFARHHVLFIGFSGADLDYDRNYLGLRDAASGNRGFTYLTYTGTTPRSSIADLADAWGNAVIVEGALPGWLRELSALLGDGADAPDLDGPAVDRLALIRDRAREWADRLGRLTTVNILASLLHASANDEIAGRLYWGIWKHYRDPKDCEGPTYARFNYLIGRHLLEYGFQLASLRPPNSVGFTIGDAPFDKDQMDNAFQYLARATQNGWPPAAADLSACLALLGSSEQALAQLKSLLDYAIENKLRFVFVDAAIAGGTVWSMLGAWSEALPYLETARQVAIQLGNEPRRARLDTHLVRFYAWKERPDDSDAMFAEGTRIAERLGMRNEQKALDTAHGYALVMRGEAAAALAPLRACTEYFQRAGRMPSFTRAALDLLHAATEARDQEHFNLAQDWLLEHERGYSPHVYVQLAEAGLYFDDLGFAQENLDRAVKASTECRNSWGLKVAEALQAQIEQRR